MRKSFPKGIPWSSTPTLEVAMGAARRGEFACRGRALPSPTDVSCTGGGTVLDPRCVGHHGAREARRPMRFLDDLSEGSHQRPALQLFCPGSWNFRLEGVCSVRTKAQRESKRTANAHAVDLRLLP